MKVKKEYLILIAVIAGLAAYIALRDSDRTLYELPESPAVAADTLTKLEISKAGETLTLARQDDRWLLEPHGYPADPNRIKAMLDAVAGLKATALVSEAQDYQRYELDEAHRIAVTAWTGGTRARAFEIGKTAPSFRHTFIKLAGDPRVFHAQGNFRNAFDQKAEGLEDKTVMTVKAAAAGSLRIHAAGSEAGFSRKAPAAAAGQTDDKSQTAGGGQPAEAASSPQWLRDDGQAADSAAVEKLLGALAALKCQKYIDGMTKTDLTDPIYRLEIDDGAAHTLSIFAKQEKETELYPATSSNSPFPFFLSAGLAEQVMKQPEELMPKPEEEKPQKEKETPS